MFVPQRLRAAFVHARKVSRKKGRFAAGAGSGEATRVSGGETVE
jgi:hypothetical protein